MPNLNKGLIVSCQATEKEPLYGLDLMKYFARCAALGGASGIRTSSVEDISSIQNEVDLPIIGIIKKNYPDSKVFITPTLEEIKSLLQTGCEVIALDATLRDRPNNEKLADLVSYVREYNKENGTNVELMADCATYEDACNAEKLGFDYIGTTLVGCTDETKDQSAPSYELIEKISSTCKANLVVEGGIWEVGQLEKVLKYNPYAVVIGTSITRPMDITQRFRNVFDKAGFNF